MQYSSIEWTDFTSNPLKYRTPDGSIVWACVHKSAGCEHCYAEQLAKRYGRGRPFKAENINTLMPFMDQKELRHMLTYKPAGGHRCFVGDMTDLFGEWVSFELLDQLFAVFALRSNVTWQLLTKRPDRMLEYLQNGPRAAWHIAGENFPLKNVWLGVSAEDQKNADLRIPMLLKTPAAIRFVSYEPALGPIRFFTAPLAGKSVNLDWIIIGGESGPGARPSDRHWLYDVIGDCKAAGVAAFIKQLGTKSQFDSGPLLRLKDRKGGSPEEWPEDLRVRQFPRIR